MKLIDKTAFKFILVGIINTLVGTGTMFLLYNLLHANYWVSSASNYIVGSIVSYFLNKHFTFKNNDKSFKSVIRFIVNISICYFIAYGAAKPFVMWMLGSFSSTIKDNVAMVVGMCLFVALNYLGQRFIVFKNDDAEKKDDTVN